jgi:hypothetical protein
MTKLEICAIEASNPGVVYIPSTWASILAFSSAKETGTEVQWDLYPLD